MVTFDGVVRHFKQEPGSAVLDQWLADRGSTLVLTSDLTRCELRRALEAAGVGARSRQDAEQWLADCALIRLSRELCDRAGALAPDARLRSLDALHTAAALSGHPSSQAVLRSHSSLASSGVAARPGSRGRDFS